MQRLARAAAVLIALGVACSEPPPSDPPQELRATLLRMIAAVEDGEPDTILRRVSPEFQSDDGLGYADVQSLVLDFLLRDESVGARLEELTIEPPIEPGLPYRVRAELTFALGAKLADSRAPTPSGAQRYAFELDFIRSGTSWMAMGGSYHRQNQH